MVGYNYIFMQLARRGVCPHTRLVYSSFGEVRNGIGRYNHFPRTDRFIWTDGTGPTMVPAKIRDVSAAQGWKEGRTGIPLGNEYRIVTDTPASDAAIFWSFFRNGAGPSSLDGQAGALTADISPIHLGGWCARFSTTVFICRTSIRGVK
jgi:hypothetical protein